MWISLLRVENKRKLKCLDFIENQYANVCLSVCIFFSRYEGKNKNVGANFYSQKNKSCNWLLKVCLSVGQQEGGRRVSYVCENLTGPWPLCTGHTHCLAGTVNFQWLCPQGTQDHFVKISIAGHRPGNRPADWMDTDRETDWETDWGLTGDWPVTDRKLTLDCLFRLLRLLSFPGVVFSVCCLFRELSIIGTVELMEGETVRH
jgi:hypothetical protein